MAHMHTTRYYFYCPACKRRLYSRRSLRQTGDPTVTCRKCGKTCVDSFVQEPAFKPFRASPRRPLDSFWFPLVLLGWIAAACLIGWLLSGSLDPTALWITLALWLLVTLWLLLPHKRAEQKKFDRWQESDARLRDGEYAAALHLFGFDVPPYYLPPFAERIKKPVHLNAVWVQVKSGKKQPAPKPHQIDSWHPGQD